MNDLDQAIHNRAGSTVDLKVKPASLAAPEERKTSGTNSGAQPHEGKVNIGEGAPPLEEVSSWSHPLDFQTQMT